MISNKKRGTQNGRMGILGSILRVVRSWFRDCVYMYKDCIITVITDEIMARTPPVRVVAIASLTLKRFLVLSFSALSFCWCSISAIKNRQRYVISLKVKPNELSTPAIRPQSQKDRYIRTKSSFHSSVSSLYSLLFTNSYKSSPSYSVISLNSSISGCRKSLPL